MKIFPYRLLEKQYYQKVDAAGLAVFRMVYGVTLFLQIIYIYYFQELIFVGHTPYHRVGLLLWSIASIALIAGYKTRWVSVINYVFTVSVFYDFYTKSHYPYDYDKIITAANFLLMFLPVSRVLSVDSLIKRRRIGVETEGERQVPILAYNLILFSCLGIPYLDSVYHKFLSVNWLSGVGIWAPMSMPQMTWPPFWDFSLILNSRFISYFINYLTMVFELIFIFTFWFRRMRMILFVIGMGFHIGILLIFPIPLFAVGCASFYILLIPPPWWRRIIPSKQTEQPAGPGAVPQNSPESLLKKSHKIGLAAAFMSLIVFLQAGYFFDYVFDYTYSGKPALINYRHTYTPEQWERLDKLILANQLVLPWSKVLLGIGNHDVMLDNQVEHYTRIQAIVYSNPNGRETWLPIIDQRGYPGFYAWDRGWSKWTHYVRWHNPEIYQAALNVDKARRMKHKKFNLKKSDIKNSKPVIIRFIDFWCLKNNIACDEGKFIIKERRVIASPVWQRHIMKLQGNYVWKDMGEVIFSKTDVRIFLHSDVKKKDLQIPR